MQVFDAIRLKLLKLSTRLPMGILIQHLPKRAISWRDSQILALPASFDRGIAYKPLLSSSYVESIAILIRILMSIRVVCVSVVKQQILELRV